MSFFDTWFKRKQPIPSKGAVSAEGATKSAPHAPPSTTAAVAATGGDGRAQEVTEAAKKWAHTVLLHPHVSEKAAVAESKSAYTFVVGKSANKHAIARAFRVLYGVTPVSVSVLWRGGKWVRFRGIEGRRSDTKHARVALPQGTTISLHKGV